MPSRHIPTHAFDDILSELGDDPAIPDPHGIRKTKPFMGAIPGVAESRPSHAKPEGLQGYLSDHQLKKLLRVIPLFACLLAVGIAFFVIYESIKSGSQSSFDQSQQQLSELKKEMGALRNEIQEVEEGLYEELDILEVSIHSFNHNKGQNKLIHKPQTIPFESEIRRWRYLGSSQMGGSHRAHFETIKGSLAFEKGAPVLGDWRLSNLEKDVATLTHLQGKSVVLKASKSE